MKRMILLAVALILLAGCGARVPQSVPQTLPAAETTMLVEVTMSAETAEPTETEAQEETLQEERKMIRLTVGDNSILAELADNETAQELAELLKNGPIAMSAHNYGGFEKVCDLGVRLISNDVQTTTEAGDIMLYSGDQVVIFYSSNSWAYTRLAKVQEDDISDLEAILSGDEEVVTIALADVMDQNGK